MSNIELIIVLILKNFLLQKKKMYINTFIIY